MRRSTNRASREASVKLLAWQPDRLRQQGMTRQNHRSLQQEQAGIDRQWSSKAAPTISRTPDFGHVSGQQLTVNETPSCVHRSKFQADEWTTKLSNQDWVLEFNICTFYHMATRCCLAHLGPLSCIPTYRENSACPTHLQLTLGATLNSTGRRSERERAKKKEKDRRPQPPVDPSVSLLCHP